MIKLLKTLCRYTNNLHPIPLVYPKNLRLFSCTSKFSVKIFMEYENSYAYSIMQSKGYAINLNKETKEESLTHEQFHELIQQNWSEKPPQLIFKMFSKLGNYSSTNNLCISHIMFDKYVDSLTDNIKFATDEELKSLFYALKLWPRTASVRTRNYVEIWVALDDECLKRFAKWTHNELLSFVSLFYMLNITKVSDFSLKCLNRLTTKAKNITAHQLVQVLFFTGVFRQQPFDMHNLEVRLEECFSEFTIDELAIISMGFFKSKTQIKRLGLVIKIINKVIENSNDVHEVSLAALLKIIRYSYRQTDNVIYNLLEVLQHQVPRLSTMSNVHLALVGTSTITFHKDCLNRIAEKIINCMSSTRVKDLERLVFVFGTFNMIPQTEENFVEQVIDELRKPERHEEINKHGRSFACCVSYLAMFGLYPIDLMNKVLNPNFLECSYGKQIYSYGKEILAIHNNAEIFFSNVEMNRLDLKTANILAKKYADYIPDRSYTKKRSTNAELIFLDVVDVLKEYKGCDYVTAGHILTHHQRGDIIMCNTVDGSPLPVEGLFGNDNFGLIRKPPDNNLWIVLILAGRNAIINNCNEATGPFQMKLRELKALGYYAELILWSIYSTLKTKKQKLCYLNSLIEIAIKHKK